MKEESGGRPQSSLSCRFVAIRLLGGKLLVYLKEYNQDIYTQLVFSGGLEDWLAEQNEFCKEHIWEYAKQIAKTQGITEELKVQEQMA